MVIIKNGKPSVSFQIVFREKIFGSCGDVCERDICDDEIIFLQCYQILLLLLN
jgi:hypothetical protein